MKQDEEEKTQSKSKGGSKSKRNGDTSGGSRCLVKETSSDL